MSELLVERASEFVDQFGLRAHDAVHLAAADFVGADVLTSADRSLCGAATAYGFHVANPSMPEPSARRAARSRYGQRLTVKRVP